MRKTIKTKELTSENLSGLLWDTALSLSQGSTDPDTANAIATQSREICRVKKLQMDAIKLVGTPTKTEIRKLTK